MPNDACEACGAPTPSYDTVHYGSGNSGYRRLCTRCFNAQVAKQLGGVEFEPARLEPIGIVDCSGETHQFHFRTRLLGPLVSLEAFELHDGEPAGYQFQLGGDPQDDQFELLGKLIQRIRRALAVKHLEEGAFGLQLVNDTVRGRIEWDEAEDGQLPLVVVDGRELSWEDFGRVLMSREGWQFKLEIKDPGEEV